MRGFWGLGGGYYFVADVQAQGHAVLCRIWSEQCGACLAGIEGELVFLGPVVNFFQIWLYL